MGILDEIVNSNKAPILFIGAGISKRYLYKYPSWEELLKLSFNKFEPDAFQFQKYIDECKRKGMSEFEINAYMGKIIESEFNKAFFDRKITINVGNLSYTLYGSDIINGSGDFEVVTRGGETYYSVTIPKNTSFSLISSENASM